MSIRSAFLLLTLVLSGLALPIPHSRPFQIYFIDVEGGQSTLVVSPSGQSLLIDTGYSNFSGRDADRILAVAKMSHVKHIDAVLITHHHADHEGGVPNLLERFTVGTFYDHGPSVEASPDRTYKAYQEAMAKQNHQQIKAGDKIQIKGIDVTAVVAAGEHFDRKGEANSYCAGVTPVANESGENQQSAGV